MLTSVLWKLVRVGLGINQITVYKWSNKNQNVRK